MHINTKNDWGWQRPTLHPCFMEIHSVFVYSCWPTHQPTHHSTNQPTYQPTYLPTNKETNQPRNQTNKPNTSRQINTPNNQPANKNKWKHNLCSGDVKKFSSDFLPKRAGNGSEHWVLKLLPALKDISKHRWLRLKLGLCNIPTLIPLAPFLTFGSHFRVS